MNDLFYDLMLRPPQPVECPKCERMTGVVTVIIQVGEGPGTFLCSCGGNHLHTHGSYSVESMWCQHCNLHFESLAVICPCDCNWPIGDTLLA